MPVRVTRRIDSDDWLEWGVLGLLLVTLCFGPLATGAVRAADSAMLLTLVAVLLLAWTARLWLDRGHRLLWTPTCWAVAAFLIYGVVRTFTAPLEWVALRELLRVAVYGAVFFVALDVARRPKAAHTLVLVLAVLGTLISAYAVFQFVTKSDRVWGFVRPAAYAGRGSGTYICPNHLAGFLVLLLPLVAASVIGGRMGALRRVFLGYALLAMFAGLGVSLSRGGWLAAGVGLVTLAGIHLWYRQHVARALVLLVLLGGMGLLAVLRTPQAQKRVEQALTQVTEGDSVAVRWSLYTASIDMWRDHPWWGVGPGHFDYRFPAYRPATVQSRPVYVHNDHLNLLVDWGAVGSGLVFLAVALTLFGAARILRYVTRSGNDLSRSTSDRWPVVAGGVSGLAGLAVHSVTDFNLQIPANAALAVTVLALLNGYLRFTSDRYWVRRRAWVYAAVGLLAVGVASGLLLQAWRTHLEARCLERAHREKQQTAARLDALQAALQVRPNNAETWYELGEAHRQRSWAGEAGYAEEAAAAIQCFVRAAQLDPFDPYPLIRTGMCLDWLGKHPEALPYYQRATALDPNNHYLAILTGWHYLQTAELRTARRWFYRSIMLHYWPNELARQFAWKTERLIKEGKPDNGPPRVGLPVPLTDSSTNAPSR